MVYRLTDRRENVWAGTMELTSGPFQGEIRPVELRQAQEGSVVITRTISPTTSQVVVAWPQHGATDGGTVTVWRGAMSG